MAKWNQYLRRSISRRFVAMMIVAQLLIMTGSGIVLWRSYNSLTNYQDKTSQFMHKESLVTDIANDMTQIFFRSRGYYAFQLESEYKEIFKERDKLLVSIRALKELPLSATEQNLMASIESFLDDFFNNVLPKASEYVQKEDYASLRQLSSSGVNTTVNELVLYAAEYKQMNKQLQEEESKRLLKALYKEGTWFIAYVIGTVVISVWITRRTASDVGAPLSRLSRDSERFANGEIIDMELKDSERKDEIGQLSRSLHSMMVQIMGKEEVLVAQNEELIAQQDELQVQQEELQDALRKMEDNEKYLEKRNHFIMSLANSNDKPEMLQSIIHHMVSALKMDKGIIVLLNDDHEHASIGISEEGAKQLVDHLNSSMFNRVFHTKQPYLLSRDAQVHEKGYETATLIAHDLYLPVLNSHEQVIACMAFTKLGRAITTRDQQEAVGLAKQISISLDKVELYEETEKQRQMTQDMLNTIQEGVQLLSLNGTTLQVNRKLCEYFDVTPCELETNSSLNQFFELLKQTVTDPDRLITSIQEIVDNPEMTADTWVYQLKNNNRYISIYGEPLYRHQERIGTLLVHRDITKEFEIDRMKSEFVSTVSHELRTPLASVLGFTELLLSKELAAERQQKYLNVIHQEAQRLTSLVNDFLDLQRMESGRQVFELEDVNVNEIIREVCDVLNVPSGSSQLTYEFAACNALVHGDPNKLKQLCTNLLNNAIKYSPAGGTIMVKTYNEGKHLLIDFVDHGLGIPADAIPQLFNRFFRVDNSDRREIGGTGLGLAIVKEILHVHKGNISVQSEFGKGSTFTVVLPLAVEEHHSAEVPLAMV